MAAIRDLDQLNDGRRLEPGAWSAAVDQMNQRLTECEREFGVVQGEAVDEVHDAKSRALRVRWP